MRSRIEIWTMTALLALAAGDALADTYEVRVTNMTKQQTFTPLLVVSHKPSVRLFVPGEAASAELETVAEAGAIGPLDALLGTLPGRVLDTNTNGELLGPGKTATIEIDAGRGFRRISVIGMLIPTNDTFVAADGIPLPQGWSRRTVTAVAYDAGTEANDQNCANIPGPRCGGEGGSELADGDEGFVFVGNGFHDLGERDPDGNEILGPFNYDWRNPVARISVQRVARDSSSDDSTDD